MIIPVRAHWANDWVCFAFGSLFNVSLLWLVAKRTPKETSPYRPILQLTASVDLIYLALFVLVVPVLLADSGYSTFLQVGPLRWLPQPYNFALMATWIYCSAFSTAALAVPFVYRYLYICWEKTHYGASHFRAMLAVPAISAAGLIAIMARTGYAPAGESQRKAREVFFNGSSQHHDIVIPYFREPSSGTTVSRYSLLTMIVVYSLVFYCGWRIYRNLISKAKGNVNADQYRALNLQLSTALILQSLVPLVVMFIPTTTILIMIVAGVRPSTIAGYTTAVFAWVPVLNPLITMWVVKAYRSAIGEWFKAARRGVFTLGATSSEVKPTTNVPLATLVRRGTVVKPG